MASASPDFSVVIAAHNEIFQHRSDVRGAARDPVVLYISLTRNFGHQACLRAGLQYARGRAVVVMDADFEHPPEFIPELVAQWRNGFKIVATRRLGDADNTTAFRRFGSRLYYRVLNALGDVHIDPGSADYLLLDRVVVDAVTVLATASSSCAGWYAGSAIRSRPCHTGAPCDGMAVVSTRSAGWPNWRLPGLWRTAFGCCDSQSGFRSVLPRSGSC